MWHKQYEEMHFKLHMKLTTLTASAQLNSYIWNFTTTKTIHIRILRHKKLLVKYRGFYTRVWCCLAYIFYLFIYLFIYLGGGSLMFSHFKCTGKCQNISTPRCVCCGVTFSLTSSMLCSRPWNTNNWQNISHCTKRSHMFGIPRATRWLDSFGGKIWGGGKGFRGAWLFRRPAASVNFSQAEIRDILLETLLAGDYEVVCC